MAVVLEQVLIQTGQQIACRQAERQKTVLGVRSRGPHVEIQVWDQGIGIAPGQLDAIFEEFYQIDPARTRRNESHGLGLGLSIVKRSARLLGAPLREIYPHLPLFEQQGLGVAVLSYCGRVGFGLIADRDLVPDLPRLREGLAESFAELESAVRRPRRRAPSRA